MLKKKSRWLLTGGLVFQLLAVMRVTEDGVVEKQNATNTDYSRSMPVD